MRKYFLKRKNCIVTALALVCLCGGMLGGLMDFFSPSVRADEDSLRPPEKNVYVSVPAPTVGAAGAILVNAETSEVLWEKDANKKLYPASTTKILTALVVLEELERLGLGLDSEIIIPEEAVGVEGSSLELKAEERLTMEELLYGLMLQSGNDGSVALASVVGGGQENDGVSNFVEKMNRRAAEIGCEGSHFINPSGLFDSEHYTTARDLAIIAAEAMKREDFRSIVGTSSWESKQSGRSFTNKNKTITQYDGATGVKIGFTKKSGRTLVASAKRGETELIAVVLNDGNWFGDAYELLDYGFEMLAKQDNDISVKGEEKGGV